ncbi:MAG: DUF4105 domain-containing protein [Cytophagaceae bacterium]|nr:DUF4105 domain-containing protein [Cytophagaceae bacterium]MDW8456790.1 DUF4105 domain-containing protein [Cytophagaceae bacterium]
MRTTYLSLLFYCLLGIPSKSIMLKLSEYAEFSLITIMPGEELYSSFGHNAFLLVDTVNKLERVYNYGTFDFNDPNFYIKFTMGKLRYMLSTERMKDMYAVGYFENRSIYQQVINLSVSQKQKLFEFLENNAREENKYYRYDFYYDNCATRLRDALTKVCGDSLQWVLLKDENKSFRNLLDPYLKYKPFQDLGMDIGQGMPADKIATPYQYMFLPEHLMNTVGQSYIFRNGKREPLVLTQRLLFKAEPSPVDTSLLLNPSVYTWIFFLVIAAFTVFHFKKNKKGIYIDALLMLLTGVLGLLIAFLWFITDHVVTPYNLNIVWAMPLNLIALFLLMFDKAKSILKYYFLVYACMCSLLVICWAILPQELNIHSLPLILAATLRAGYHYYRLKP